jgi:signal transduction histidine kinase
MLEALDDGVVDDAVTTARYHRQLITETERLGRLVDDLFELSRLQAEAVRLRLEPVCLTDIVSDAIASASPVAEAKGVRLSGGVSPSVGDVAASAPELGRVVGNLLENAIRHTPSGGAVVVEVHNGGDEAVVSVRDGCGGIPAHALDRVFEVAYRGDDARTPGGGGGLGLAIAHGLVEAHQGEIRVGNVDGGCRFSVHLPVRAGSS